MKFEICPMVPDDAFAVAQLEAECFLEPWSEKALLGSMVLPEYLFLAAKCDGKLAGYAGAYQTVDVLNITNIAVFERWRRMGAAQSLLAALDEIAEKSGLYGITLEVRVSNRAAISLYEKNGYEKAGVRKGFYAKPREDGLIMWKYFQR